MFLLIELLFFLLMLVHRAADDLPADPDSRFEALLICFRDGVDPLGVTERLQLLVRL